MTVDWDSQKQLGMMERSLYIITGCSKGLGKALTDLVTQTPGSFVVGISRTAMEDKAGFLHLSLDLSNIDNVVENLGEGFPVGDFRRFVLINNAGWIGEIAPLGKLDPVGIQKIQNINLISPALLMNEFVKRYGMEKGDKTVINISSGAAFKPIDGWSGYCSSKAALNHLTHVAQEESDLKELGIKYYALSPGIIDTDMQGDIRETSLEDFSRGDSFRAYKKDGDLSTPEEIAKKILYLIENQGDFDEVLQDVRSF